MADACPVCGRATLRSAGTIEGRYHCRAFTLLQCTTCWYAWVADPWTDFAAIYDEAYYGGRGADPLADYIFELDHPDETIRQYEWRGILDVVSHLVRVDAATEWLDFGCGNGGLVRFARQQGVTRAVGYDTGWIADRARTRGLPLLTDRDLEACDGRFDLITAIEVVEHIPDPIGVLRTISRLLKPGGTLFLTTGNAQPYRDRLPQWRYVVPELHVSFFEPATLAAAMTKAGLEPAFRGFLPGFPDIIRFKVLKALRHRRQGLLERLVPWSLASRLIDARFGVSSHPIAVKPKVAA
jgi:SAM-dependent methyltransferase